MEIWLGGKAKSFADFTQGLVSESEKALCFFQLTAHDEVADLKAQFLLEFTGQDAPIHIDRFRHMGHADILVRMVGDILNCPVDTWGHIGRYFSLTDPAGKVEDHSILQLADLIDVRHFFHGLEIGV